MDILELLADGDDEMLLNEVASKAGLNASTCHHLLATLVKRGFAGQSPRTRGYFIGPRVTDLSDSRLKKFNLLEIAMPEVRRLNDATRESVHLSVMQGVALVTLAQLDSKLPVRVGFDGAMEADAAHATAAGKAILAWLPEAEIARVIAHGGLKQFTDKTIPTIAELMEHLRLVRRNGYSLDDEEYQSGVVCVGAAIRESSGRRCRRNKRFHAANAGRRRTRVRRAATGHGDCIGHIGPLRRGPGRASAKLIVTKENRCACTTRQHQEA